MILQKFEFQYKLRFNQYNNFKKIVKKIIFYKNDFPKIMMSQISRFYKNYDLTKITIQL